MPSPEAVDGRAATRGASLAAGRGSDRAGSRLASVEDEFGSLLTVVVDRTTARFFQVTAFGAEELPASRRSGSGVEIPESRRAAGHGRASLE